MRTVVKILAGSHMYGTATPESDSDWKSVFVPSARDILLQRVRPVFSRGRPKGHGERNTAADVDTEDFSLKKFLDMAAGGFTNALDMLFAPPASVTESSPEWDEIVGNRHRLVTRDCSQFVAYCRRQAAKYGIKGSRVAATRRALALLDAGIERHGDGFSKKLELMEAEIRAFDDEHARVVNIVHPTGRDQWHWEVCDRKMPFRASILSARDLMASLVAEYGVRALQAERNDGLDWKALSHAVRVGQESLELLSTGAITLPLPDRAHVLDVKLGRVPYVDVAREIESLMAAVEAAKENSRLPSTPDVEWIEDFVVRAHGGEVLRHLEGKNLR